MTRKESDMLRELSNLISKCPAPSANIYALNGYINACKDYRTINKYVIEFLNNYSEYIYYRSSEFNTEVAYNYKQRAKTALHMLRKFVQKRTEENWQ